MNAFFFRASFFFTLVLGLCGAAFAGNESTPFPAGQPIDSRMDLGFFGLLGGGMTYSVGGKPITRYEDFKGLIYPLRDEEASRLIRDAEDCHWAAWVLYGTGATVGVDVGLAFKPVPFLGVDWIDRIATGVVAAEIPWGIGALLDNSAEARKYNAVQRYNYLIQQKEDAFLNLKPQLVLAQDGPRLGLRYDF
ncbi:MAG TPA: hypothetical protein VJ873_07520 [bacterium]|nr:hypothetical protein [bacterium]